MKRWYASHKEHLHKSKVFLAKDEEAARTRLTTMGCDPDAYDLWEDLWQRSDFYLGDAIHVH